jgi:hypothetical protein
MEAADGWFIAHLRARPRRHRLEDLLLDRRLRGLDIHALADHLDKLESEIVDLRARLSRADEPDRPPGHVLFLPTPDGYVVIEAEDPPPPVGQQLLVDNGTFRVHRVGRSPFPRDRRPCLYLEATPTEL